MPLFQPHSLSHPHKTENHISPNQRPPSKGDLSSPFINRKQCKINGNWGTGNKTEFLLAVALHEKYLRKSHLFQRKQGVPEAYVSTQAQPSEVMQHTQVFAERTARKRERGLSSVSYSCVLLDDSRYFQDADSGLYFPILRDFQEWLWST